MAGIGGVYKSGEIIEASPKILPFIKHCGVLLVENGKVLVLHNTPFKGTIQEDLEEWKKSRLKIKIYNSKLVGKSNSDIIKQFSKCKDRYQLFTYNCEHFIDCMEGRKQSSEQVTLFVTAIVAFLIYKKIKK
jgi:hypothetical protein